MLLSQGHNLAYKYPLGRLQDEAEICRIRFRQNLSLKTDLFYQAMTTAFMCSTPGIERKDAENINRSFRKLLEDLYD